MHMVKGIHHISLKAAPQYYAETVRFYQEILELPLIRKQDHASFLDAGNIVLEILDSGEITHPGVLEHFALTVSDFDTTLAKVKAAGYEITRVPEDFVFTGEIPYSVHIAFFRGPAGELVELFRENETV